jgi:hypothetical protein
MSPRAARESCVMPPHTATSADLARTNYGALLALDVGLKTPLDAAGAKVRTIGGWL